MVIVKNLLRSQKDWKVKNCLSSKKHLSLKNFQKVEIYLKIILPKNLIF